MTPPRCPMCGTEMLDRGPAELEQADPPHVPARRWLCVGPRCPETVSILPVQRTEEARP